MFALSIDVVHACWEYPVPKTLTENGWSERTVEPPSRSSMTIGTSREPSPDSLAIVPETAHGPVREPSVGTISISPRCDKSILGSMTN